MKGYDYYSVEEFKQALESDQDNLLKKCSVIAKTLVSKYQLRMKAEDLFQEAICRILEDSRHIPKEYHLTSTIGKVMKGIAYDTFKRRDEEVFRKSEDEESHQIMHYEPNADEASQLDERWQQLLNLFSDDDDVLAFLQATKNGLNKSEIVGKIFSGDVQRYDTTRRRVIRGGSRLNQEVKQ